MSFLTVSATITVVAIGTILLRALVIEGSRVSTGATSGRTALPPTQPVAAAPARLRVRQPSPARLASPEPSLLVDDDPEDAPTVLMTAEELATTLGGVNGMDDLLKQL